MCFQIGEASGDLVIQNNEVLAGASSGLVKNNNDSLDSSAGSDERPEFTVEEVLGHREDENGHVSYLTHWENFDETHDTWEPPESFMGATPVHVYLWGIINTLKEELRKYK